MNLMDIKLLTLYSDNYNEGKLYKILVTSIREMIDSDNCACFIGSFVSDNALTTYPHQILEESFYPNLIIMWVGMMNKAALNIAET